MDLLRLLEPAVRPGGLPGPAVAPSQPIESRDFDSILQEAQQMSPNDVEGSMNEVMNNKPDPLAALARVDRIDNADLRSLMGNGRA